MTDMPLLNIYFLHMKITSFIVQYHESHIPIKTGLGISDTGLHHAAGKGLID